jgi:hypothetical protein
MTAYIRLTISLIRRNWLLFLLISIGFPLFYYLVLLLLTMWRFGEIPNYVEVYNIFHVYKQIFDGTPSLTDALMILKDEAWIETGYKNPEYYGVATWSYMLIPPKMLLVFLMGMLLGLFAVLTVSSRKMACQLKSEKKLVAAAGLGSTFVCLTSATLTWVVCCATPSWVVALSMLGMSSSLALWLEPMGKVMTMLGIGIMLVIIIYQLRNLVKVWNPRTVA